MDDLSSRADRFRSSAEFFAWFDSAVRDGFGIDGVTFLTRFRNGEFNSIPLARDLASVIPLLDLATIHPAAAPNQ